MGKKIQYDVALKMAQTEKNDSIYAKPNQYGYKLNVNHPSISTMYERYKDKLQVRILSDEQRLEFEQMILSAIQKRRSGI